MNSSLVADRVQGVADRFAKNWGRPIALRQVVAGAFDAATDTVAGPTETDYPVTAVVTDYKAHEIKGLIQVGDRRVWVPAGELPDGVAIDTTWVAIFDDREYEVISAPHDRIGDKVIGQTLTVR